jgi:hypothetical protein
MSGVLLAHICLLTCLVMSPHSYIHLRLHTPIYVWYTGICVGGREWIGGRSRLLGSACSRLLRSQPPPPCAAQRGADALEAPTRARSSTRSSTCRLIASPPPLPGRRAHLALAHVSDKKW